MAKCKVCDGKGKTMSKFPSGKLYVKKCKRCEGHGQIVPLRDKIHRN